MWKNKTVSVVFPAYNEAGNIQAAVQDFMTQPWVDEVIVVDNNSRDGTDQRVRHTRARLVQEKRQGYGFALQCGMQEAQGDLIVLAEPDGTFRGDDLIKLLAYSGDFDLVMGTRTHKGFIQPGAHMPWYLRMGNLWLAKFLQVIFGIPSISDCGCTFRLIDRAAYQQMAPLLRVGQSHFLPEMVILAGLKKKAMIEVPVHYRKRIGESKITGHFRGMLKTGLGMLMLIIRYRILTFFCRI